ncbi:hypothetical protein [Stenotrophomonas sp. SORGH_AS_0321]|uniref:hypothetical protein n=1 Tax=Stenotrophomonas sp. SORGH_AS_0321 TaxID=3041787 RepID=UPI00285659FE|nr:hypothetical protein [Stenotrophomonas sp. SORGH_AS_0321]MDR6096079.1 hypothetical protein [Stenotrophomonas sp. SORGH_AS_0321]
MGTTSCLSGFVAAASARHRIGVCKVSVFRPNPILKAGKRFLAAIQLFSGTRARLSFTDVLAAFTRRDAGRA